MDPERVLYDAASAVIEHMVMIQQWPIDPGRALWAFFESVERSGIPVRVRDMERTAQFIVYAKLGSQTHRFEAEFTYDEILKGCTGTPLGSRRSIYMSMAAIFDHIGDAHPFIHKKHYSAWGGLRARCRDMMDIADSLLEKDIWRYQETLVLNARTGTAELGEPRLFKRVLATFPYTQILPEASTGYYDADNTDPGGIGRCTLTPESIHERIQNGEIPCPDEASASSMIEYFMGIYTAALWNEKGYADDHVDFIPFHRIPYALDIPWLEHIANMNSAQRMYLQAQR